MSGRVTKLLLGAAALFLAAPYAAEFIASRTGASERVLSISQAIDSVRDGRMTRVAYLGLAPLRPQDQLSLWLQPRVADRRSVESMLAEATDAVFPVAVLEDRALAMDPVRALLEGSTDPGMIAAANMALEVNAVVYAHVVPDFATGGVRLALKIASGTRGDRAQLSEASAGIPRALARWNLRPLFLLGLLALYRSRRLLAGTGGIAVKIPDVGRDKGAYTTIYVTTTRPTAKSQADRSNSRFATAVTAVVTQFSDVPPRSYYVVARRTWMDPETKKELKVETLDREVDVVRHQTSEVRFDFEAVARALEIVLMRGPDEVDERVLVGTADAPGAGCYRQSAGLELALGSGVHTVRLGCGDRVLERNIEIGDASQKHTLRFDLDDPEQIVFDECLDAVEAYVQGEMEQAAQALLAAGQEQRAHVIYARVSEQIGATGEAARHLEAAGQLTEAAELSASSDGLRAAELFEQAGELGKAADQYRRCGDIANALRLYEACGDVNNAVSCAMCVGDSERALELLESTGAYLEGSRIALELGEPERAIRILQRVPLRDPAYGDACSRLSELFLVHEEPELALQKLDEAADTRGDDNMLELREQVGNALEENGSLQLALEAFETIRKRDIHYPGVATRISELRARLSSTTSPESVGVRTRSSDRYEMLGEIGRGAMGVVYKARDMRLGRIVALKVLPENMKSHPTVVKLFLREARSAAALNHENIVTFFDADQDGDNYYLTMEYLEGVPLDALLERRGALNATETLSLAVQIACGLEYAHDNSIVHRDIKPSNLFLTRTKKLKIMDFGLAKAIEKVRNPSSLIAGTPHYMAPEQAAGDAVDHRADLYAFGVTLFRFATGVLPFPEGDALYHHRNTEPPDPRSVSLDIPEGLSELILQLMAKSPDERPSSTGDVRGRLAVLLGEALRTG